MDLAVNWVWKALVKAIFESSNTLLFRGKQLSSKVILTHEMFLIKAFIIRAEVVHIPYQWGSWSGAELIRVDRGEGKRAHK
jgi:hypothetical protein